MISIKGARALNSKSTLKIEEVTKKFPGVLALDKVSLEAYSGEVLGLIGVNGAGKSTLMNVLGGVLKSDTGRIKINDVEVRIHSPKEAEQLGIVFIHQEPLLFSTMTVAENIFITQMKHIKNIPILDHLTMKKEAKKYLDILGCEVNPESNINELPIGEQQMVEIARALSQGGRIFLFDEPTSSLSLKEKERLFEVINSLRKQGYTIIYISHFLDEVEDLCDRFAVLRDGRVTAKGVMADYTRNEIVQFLMGQNVIQFISEKTASTGIEVLRVENLKGSKLTQKASFSVHEGEILGVWGLLGSGRTELFRTILGLDNSASGKLFLKDSGELRQISKKKLLKSSGYVTENRHADGLFLPLSLWKNASSVCLEQFASKVFRFLNVKKEREASSEYIARMKIAASSTDIRVEQLSGGNQQKVIMAKWLQRTPRVFFLDEPTRGVDVGAKVEIHKLIIELANQGSAVMVISSEIDEILSLSDRVLVMNKGNIVSEVLKDEIKKETLMGFCLGKEEIESGI
jgi:ABC-type sugar transport system ATPase subunit